MKKSYFAPHNLVTRNNYLFVSGKFHFILLNLGKTEVLANIRELMGKADAEFEYFSGNFTPKSCV
jgi:hypothetical protein